MSIAHMLFARDFEAEMEAERLLRELEARTHTVEDLARVAEEARAEGYAAGVEEGHARGRQETLAGIEVRRVETLERTILLLQELGADRAAHRQQLEADMIGFATLLADKVFPDVIRHLGQARAETEISRVVRRAIGSTTLDIRLAPSVAESMTEDLARLAAESRQVLRVIPDPGLEPSEVRATWQNGRSNYSFSAICRSIQTLIRRFATNAASSDQAGVIHE